MRDEVLGAAEDPAAVDHTARRASLGRLHQRGVLRADLLIQTADGLKLARREITVDEAVLRTQNLAIFL